MVDKNQGRMSNGSAVRGHTDGLMDGHSIGRTDRRCQVHYLPPFMVDKNQGRRSNGSAVRGWTDGLMDGRTDGRYQMHYLPRFAVDKYCFHWSQGLGGWIDWDKTFALHGFALLSWLYNFCS